MKAEHRVDPAAAPSSPSFRQPPHRLRGTAVRCLAAALLLAGCASPATNVTVSDPARITRSGFLTDYKALAPSPGAEGTLCWRQPGLDLKAYDKVLINRIVVTLKADQQQGIDPTELKALVDYFHASLVKALKPQMQVVEQPGPGVIVLRIALTNLVPTQVSRSLMGTAIPYAFTAELASGPASGRPAGSTPYLGETGMEIQFTEGATNQILAECADAQIGRKYAAAVEEGAEGATDTWVKGYMNSFQAWAYAQNAFDKWAKLIADRFAVLRGVKPAQYPRRRKPEGARRCREKRWWRVSARYPSASRGRPRAMI